ncbi:MAG: flavodoxin [uncultured bacterium (gcode 4)]|uniref:Flavodoxin n=1 Tax=uncultured bacterium (gcode 4) TaxID=1234023 RepID=K2A3U2_9BACT|nr:MAG: flavodoxin [uncultured bacterium (gcode 4)]
MKSLIIYKSIHHKNTQRIAIVMAKILNADLISPEKVNFNNLKNYDLFGFGSGIYFSAHHESLFKLLDDIPQMKGKKAFIITTSGTWEIRLLNDFNTPLKKKLKEKGFNVIGIFTCRGFDSFGLTKYIGGLNKGRPNEDDIKKAQEFAEKLIGT